MRFVPYKQQVRHPETDAFLGIAGTAFAVRPTDDGGLSTTWVEFYGEHSPATIAVAANAFRGTLDSKKLPGKAYFAIGQAGATRKVASDRGKQIRLVHAPDGTNVGHVEIHRFSDDDRALLDALAIEVYDDHVAVSSIKLPSPPKAA